MLSVFGRQLKNGKIEENKFNGAKKTKTQNEKFKKRLIGEHGRT